MLNLFGIGERQVFFKKWEENIPQERIDENVSAQKLELELNIHFAVYPFRNNTNQNKDVCKLFFLLIITK